MLPYVSVPFEYAAGQIGASPDELKLIFSFLLSYPLAGLLKRLPDTSPRSKNAFIIAVSIFLLVGFFDLWSGLLTIFIQAAGTYAMAAYIKGPYMPWIAFVFNMGYMSISHITRQIVSDPGLVDITGAQMVLVMKLTAFAWNVFDGSLPESELVDDYQKDRALRQLPDLLDYAGFVLFFPSLFAGPAFDFAEYSRWINTSMFDLPPGVDPAKAPATRGKRRIPRSGTPAMLKAGQGLLWIVAFLQFSGWYNTDTVLGDGFKQYNFFYRIFCLYMFGFTTRMKYYGVWALTEGACILSGIGYKGFDPKTGKADWSRLQNVRPWGVELAQNSHAYLGNWNINTNHWLRNYVYLRVTPKGKKPGFRASMATFTTSAFWHGFYPGYYLAFVLASFIQNLAKNARRLFRPFFLSPDDKTPLPRKRYYDIASWLTTQAIFSFTTVPFVLLRLDDSLVVWARVYFYVVIIVAGSSLLLLTPAKQYLQSQLKARSQQKPSSTTGATAGLQRMDSHDRQPTYLGLPNDPGREWDEMVDEIREEVERRKREGKPITEDLRRARDQMIRNVTAEVEARRREGKPVDGDLKRAVEGEKSL